MKGRNFLRKGRLASNLLLTSFFNLIEKMSKQIEFYQSFSSKLKKIAKEIFNYLKIRNVSVDIFFLENEEMIILERKFMGKRKKIVEVLSFNHPPDFPSPDKKGRFLGEIYINKNVKDPKRVVYLLIHGVLHLLGFDHQRKSDTIKMEELERKILKLLDSKKIS